MSMILAAGLFAQPAMAFDHSHAQLATVLDGAVTNEGVDYARIGSRKDTLDAYLSEVANAPVGSFSNDEKLAFYINAYNALTINLIVEEKVKSIKDIAGGKVWEQRSFKVGRDTMTLNQIENDNVRKLGDGRIHAAVNCASKGCPPLAPKPFTPDGLDAQLDAGAKRWVSTNAFKMVGDVARLNKIFDWYGDDFVDMPAGTATPEDKQKAAKAFITKYGGDLSGAKSFEWNDYDWSLNSAN